MKDELNFPKTQYQCICSDCRHTFVSDKSPLPRKSAFSFVQPERGEDRCSSWHRTLFSGFFRRTTESRKKPCTLPEMRRTAHYARGYFRLNHKFFTSAAGNASFKRPAPEVIIQQPCNNSREYFYPAEILSVTLNLRRFTDSETLKFSEPVKCL